MKTRLQYTAVLFFAAALFAACSKDEVNKPEEEVVVPPKVISECIKQDVKTGVYQVTNLPLTPTGGNYAQEIVKQYKVHKPLYFNFTTAAIVTEDKAAGLEWDVVFMDANTYHNSAILLNNGTINNRPWSQNGSVVLAAYIAEDFDNVKNVPSDLNFTLKNVPPQSTSTPLASSWAVYSYTEAGTFSYYIPQKNLTYVIKLNDGRYVKLCVQNVYQVADITKPYESSATSVNGFITFKYFIAPAGSKDLNTAK